MKKLKLEPMRPQTARAFRYLEVPKELLENEDYADLDDGAKLLYSKMLERAGLSAQHIDKFTDKNGRLFIIYTVEQMEHDLKHSHPTIVKLTKQLVDKGLIEKVRQGQGKPSKIYIYDFATAPHDEPEKPTSKGSEPQEVKNFNFKKSTAFTSRSKDSELQEVKDFNGIELDNKDFENKDLPSYQRLMELEESVQNQRLVSTALLTAGNRVLWARLNAALDCFKELCASDPSPRVQRQYQLVYERYMAVPEKPVEDVLELMGIERTRYFTGISEATKTICVILFGAESAEDIS